MQAAAITGTTWLMLTLLIRLILPAYPQFIVSTSIGLILFILPIVNHARIFLAVAFIAVPGSWSSYQYTVLCKRLLNEQYDVLYVCSTVCMSEAVQAAAITETTWLMLALLMRLVLAENPQFIR